jgi:hypothetical protein
MYSNTQNTFQNKNKKIEKNNIAKKTYFICFKDVSSILHFLQYEKKIYNVISKFTMRRKITYFQSNLSIKCKSHSLVVKAENSQLKGCVFKSRHRIGTGWL